MAAAGQRAPSAGAEGDAMVSKVVGPPKGKMASFLDFLYDKQSGKVMGRTGKSWLEITVFYIIFYSCLAGFFAICLAVFVHTLSEKEPRFYGSGSILGVNPGMGYQPWLKDDPESTLIHFDYKDNRTYSKYLAQMHEIFKRYENTTGVRECTGLQSNEDDVVEGCRVDLDVFRNAGCGESNDFGFKEGKPCVILTLNRLINWKPDSYPTNSVPKDVESRYRNGSVAVSCHGEYHADDENIGPMKYIPPEGMAGKYFPYRVRSLPPTPIKNYHQPFAMVKFMNPPIGQLIEVECKAYAYNIIHDRQDRQGMVHFELLVDGPEKNS